MFRPPKTRTEFWTSKIAGNKTRDQRNYSALQDAGWKAIVIWECAVTKKLSLSDEQLEIVIATALTSKDALLKIRG